MEATLQRAPATGAAVWTGRVLSGLVVVFLLFDGGIKIVEMDVVKQSLAELGYPVDIAFGLGP